MRLVIVFLTLCIVSCRSGSDFVTGQSHGGTGGGSEPWDGGAAGHFGGSVDASDPYSGDSSVSQGDAAVTPPDGCGDGMADPMAMTEACDDGDNDDGDGCSRTCTVEPGFLCPPKGGECAAQCGDGMMVGHETCDDHNSADNDGCSRTCMLESGWACPTPGEDCVAALCGDGTIAGGEACDDGDSDNGDGCSTACAVEEGWVCIGSVCSAASCGDGHVAGAEVCDDGGTTNGDGCLKDCSGTEPYFNCPAAGGKCTKYTRCGDGTATSDEGCDDFNQLDGDGCSKDCTIEPGFTCASGMSCFTTCGDGVLASVEQCDDGGTSDGPSVCKGGTKDGTTCTTDVECASVAACNAALECTGGAAKLAKSCTINANCNTDGACTNNKCTAGASAKRNTTCANNSDCGTDSDGICSSVKRCSGGVNDSQKCSAAAECPLDDGHCVVGDGCSATCTLQPGFACGTAGTACTGAVCGDAHVDGLEQCDDGNQDLGDGCTPLCKYEPDCSNGPCDSRCGDGIKASDEECDDGNARDNDGCSHACKLELGYTCQVVDSAPASTVQIPIVLRDFHAHDFKVARLCTAGTAPVGTPCTGNGDCGTGGSCSAACGATEAHCCNSNEPNCTAGHVDFQSPAAGNGGTGMVQDTLDADGKPQRATSGASSADDITDTSFYDWYRDSDRNVTVLDKLTLSLTQCPGGTCGGNNLCSGGDLDGKACGDYYAFDSQTFFPLTGKGYNSSSLSDGSYDETYGTCDPQVTRGNFHFTSEVRYWFKYEGDEVLYFRGDDDVWVFINGKLAVDIGGIHGALSGCISLKSGRADCTGNPKSSDDLGLTVGNIYEVVVFQAERNICLSSYKLTLAGFFTSKSKCVSQCGDGVVTSDEVCDLGSTCHGGGSEDGKACMYAAGSADSQCSMASGTCASNNQGTSPNLPYNGCSQDCKERGPYCGDNTPNGTEQCDKGAAHNDGKYGVGNCNPDCTLSPRCGDSKIDGFSGEQCDNGAQNVDNTYGACTKTCKFGPRCGDGVVQANKGEACDNGTNKSPYKDSANACAPGCVQPPACGDGIVQATFGEQCDDGSNTGEYGGCMPTCKRAGYCGDGQVSEADGEQCDDANTNSFDGCSSTCQAENLLF